ATPRPAPTLRRTCSACATRSTTTSTRPPHGACSRSSPTRSSRATASTPAHHKGSPMPRGCAASTSTDHCDLCRSGDRSPDRDHPTTRSASMTTAELRERAYAELTAPGAPFELTEEVVLGERMPVFKNRHRSLREVLQASARHGDAGYLTIDGTTLSFRAHLDVVGSVARALAERHGIGKGDRVA